MKITANLCKCNNCDTVLIDQNPQANAKEYELTGKEELMVQVLDIDEIVPKGGERHYFWACPECLTDGYLVDL